MGEYLSFQQFPLEDFFDLKDKYETENKKYKKRMLCRVGADGGFYAEIDSMMEAMLYCAQNNLQFVLAADDANFSDYGWEEFFVPFCEQNHHWLNKYVNRRFKRNHALFRFISKILEGWLKIRSHCSYLTSDLFLEYCMNQEYLSVPAKWDLFGIDGPVKYEYIKIRKLAYRFNEKTEHEIQEIIDELQIPEEFISLQIRGGDKITQRNVSLFAVEDAVHTINQYGLNKYKNIFLFTDEYSNVKRLKEFLPSCNIYTLAEETDAGYDNVSFAKMPWEYRRKKLVRLMATVEICILSKIHLFDPNANPTAMIRGAREDKNCMILLHRN